MAGPLAGKLVMVSGKKMGDIQKRVISSRCVRRELIWIYPSAGAASGIGRAACKILARDGAIIIGVDCNLPAAQKTIAELPKPSQAFHMDISSADSVNQTLSDIISSYQRPPSIVVNAAGIIKDNFLLKMSESDFDAVINVNLKVIGRWTSCIY